MSLVEGRVDTVDPSDQNSPTHAGAMSLVQGALLVVPAAAVAIGGAKGFGFGILLAFAVQAAFSLIYLMQIAVTRRGRVPYAKLFGLSAFSALALVDLGFGAGFLGLVYVLPIVFLAFGFWLRRRQVDAGPDEKPNKSAGSAGSTKP